MRLLYLLKEMNLLNIIVIIMFVWLISISICLALLYRDYVQFKYTDQAKEMVRKPGKGFLVPGSGFFAVRDKRKAVVNDDRRGYEIERDAQ